MGTILIEFIRTSAAWLNGEGDLPGLLIAWLQVAAGTYPVDDKTPEPTPVIFDF